MMRYLGEKIISMETKIEVKVWVVIYLLGVRQKISSRAAEDFAAAKEKAKNTMGAIFKS